ncbi:hypothetical protein F4553_006677 [Allocatelliglobosispora scoriae]|uniref:Uncharacterized protein n=1 Tax=Allocatelliglobosispora scoriae TaxID=643052 RepID=A0A841C279_9ACTN|nr:hypothetical protein [Allocatelliglobosispora scoriae]MBB5873243.1 hypothetical protein [Allocatelliglobosispora scoriae]
MTPTPVVTLRELIAGNLRRLRASTTSSTEDVARSAQRLGLDWTAAWVQAAERGQRALTSEQLLSLPLVLSAALGHRVSLSDLLLGDEHVRIGKDDSEPIPATAIREVITAPAFRRSFTGLVERDSDSQRQLSAAAQAAEKIRAIARANLGEVDIRVLTRAETGASDLETKLAKKLGVPEIVVIAASALLWGRSMTEERQEQMKPGEDGKPPLITVVTKALSAAVSDRIAAADANRA